MPSYTDQILAQAGKTLGLENETNQIIEAANNLLIGTTLVMAGTTILNSDGITTGVAIESNQITREIRVASQDVWGQLRNWTTQAGEPIRGVLLGEFTEAEVLRALDYAYTQGERQQILDGPAILQRIRDSR